MSAIDASTAQYSCKIGGTTFQVLSLTVRETISELSFYSLTLWSDDPEVDVKGMVRKPAEVKISWGSNEKFYYAIVSSFTQTDAGHPGLGGVEREWGEYRAELVPTLWLLGLKRNCRIFQNMSADAIVKKVLDERGMAGKYESRMSGYPVREFCVQYRETDFDFISRLMEEEGAFYYFTHDGEEKMVIGDSSGHYGTCSPESSVEYKTAAGVLASEREHFATLEWDSDAFVGKVKYKDYDYRDPKKPLLAQEAGTKHTDVEVYDYQVERYRDAGRGSALAKVAVGAHGVPEERLHASGAWRSASAGSKLTLSKAWRGDLDGEWCVFSVNQSASQTAEGGVQVWTTLQAIRGGALFRPPQIRPKPHLGVQTAKVVGPAGQRIYMDDLGRAKVQFHWDLEGHEDENSSCWIRVAQPYAGKEDPGSKKWGFEWHPLIGDEAVVEFLDGDPDDPLIVGSVYNGKNTPLLKPDDLIRSRILSPYQHELLFDDKNATIRLETGGDEMLEMVDKNPGENAPPEGKVTLTTVGAQSLKLEDDHETLGNSFRIETSDNHHIYAGEKGANRGIEAQTKLGGFMLLNDETKKYGIRSAGGHKLAMEDVQGDLRLETSGGHKVRLDDTNRKILIESAGKGRIEINDEKLFIELSSPDGKQKIHIDYSGTGVNLTCKKGDVKIASESGDVKVTGKTINMKSDGDFNINADSLFVIAKSIDINGTSGISLTSADISIDSSGPLKAKGTTTTVEGTASAKVKGAVVSTEASGINTVKGALVKIN
jgi:type VI secretion system secreted protein VgrG